MPKVNVKICGMIMQLYIQYELNIIHLCIVLVLLWLIRLCITPLSLSLSLPLSLSSLSLSRSPSLFLSLPDDSQEAVGVWTWGHTSNIS